MPPNAWHRVGLYFIKCWLFLAYPIMKLKNPGIYFSNATAGLDVQGTGYTKTSKVDYLLLSIIFYFFPHKYLGMRWANNTLSNMGLIKHGEIWSLWPTLKVIFCELKKYSIGLSYFGHKIIIHKILIKSQKNSQDS